MIPLLWSCNARLTTTQDCCVNVHIFYVVVILGARVGGQFLFANQCVLFNLLLHSRLSTQSPLIFYCLICRIFGSLFDGLATLLVSCVLGYLVGCLVLWLLGWMPGPVAFFLFGLSVWVLVDLFIGFLFFFSGGWLVCLL